MSICHFYNVMEGMNFLKRTLILIVKAFQSKDFVPDTEISNNQILNPSLLSFNAVELYSTSQADYVMHPHCGDAYEFRHKIKKTDGK